MNQTRTVTNAYARDWYHNKNGKVSIDAAKKRYREKIRGYITAAKQEPCTDCKSSFPTECMDFDHIGANKLFVLGRSINSLPQVKREIAKCELVCANCHRIRTRKRLKETPSVNGTTRLGT